MVSEKELLIIIFVLPVTWLLSFLVCLWLRGRAARFGLLDLPNQRSLHDRPTPKGGGIGIACGLAAAFAVVDRLGLHLDGKILATLTGALAMGLLGFFSDRRNLSPLVRFTAQALIALVVLFLVGYPRALNIIFQFQIGLFGLLFGLIWLTAITNFYNFMDGIDGLAGMQAIVAGTAVAAFGFLLGSADLIPAGLLLAAAVAGFVVLNLAKNKIFMGDCGSYLCGFYLAAMGLSDVRLLVPVALVLSVFVFDTVVTLFLRARRAAPWYQAHHEHFYQRAVRLGYSHKQVTFCLTAVFLALALAAVGYLIFPPLVKGGILIAVILCLSALAKWIVLKEHAKNPVVPAGHNAGR